MLCQQVQLQEHVSGWHCTQVEHVKSEGWVCVHLVLELRY
jgi:hypothetical protein